MNPAKWVGTRRERGAAAPGVGSSGLERDGLALGKARELAGQCYGAQKQVDAVLASRLRPESARLARSFILRRARLRPSRAFSRSPRRDTVCRLDRVAVHRSAAGQLA